MEPRKSLWLSVLSIYLLGIIMFSPTVVQGATKTIAAFDDTYTNTQAPSTAYGAATSVMLQDVYYFCNCFAFVICQTCHTVAKVAMKFEISSLETACIESAKLILTKSANQDPTSGTLYMAPTLNTWVGSTLTANLEASQAAVIDNEDPAFLQSSTMKNEGDGEWSWVVPATWIVSACENRNCVLSLGMQWVKGTHAPSDTKVNFFSIEAAGDKGPKLVVEYKTCSSNGKCVKNTAPVNNDFCTCNSGFQLAADGFTCNNIDDCSPGICGLGTCIDGVNTYTCNCAGTGFQGKNCQNDIDECLSAPCVHGKCNNLVNNYSCDCNPGWTGTNCNQNIDDCVGVTCHNDGKCQDLVDGYFCECTPAWTGDHCEESTSGCTETICKNGAQCIDGTMGEYSCNCLDGWTGINCQTNIDDCATVDCGPGKCVDGIASYTCDCTGTDHTGGHCETKTNNCAGKTCNNQGTCFDGFYSYSCTCNPGFTGENCEINIDECTGNPCGINADSCVDGINSFTCICKLGWTGTLCNEAVSCPAEIAGNANWPTSQASSGVVTGTCIQGYTHTGNPPTRVCKQTGKTATWDPISGSCIQLKCLSETVYPVTWPETPSNTFANVVCPSGFISSNGKAVRLCDSSGHWGVIQYPCEAIFCAEAEFGNAVWPKTGIGASASGSCIDPYAGNPIADCELDSENGVGKWSTSILQPCEINISACPADEQHNITYVRTLPNTAVTKPCPDGKFGKTTRHCGNDGKWGSVNLDNCVELPSPVSALDITNVGVNSISIVWAASTNAAGYQIRISLNRNDLEICCGGKGKNVTGFAFDITGLPEFQEVIIQVLAGNQYGFESVGYLVETRTHIAAPKNLTASFLNYTSVALQWPINPNSDWYNVFIKETLKDEPKVIAPGGSRITGTSLTIHNLKPGTSYTVQVHCGRAIGNNFEYYEPRGVQLIFSTLSTDGSTPTPPSLNVFGDFWNQYGIFLVIVIMLGLTLIAYLISHFRNKRARNFIIFTIGISFTDVVVHILFLTSLPRLSLYFTVCLVFIAVPCLLNLMACMYIWFKELKTKDSISNFENHVYLPTICCFISICNTENFSLIASGALNYKHFSHEFSLGGQKRLAVLGCISNVFEDIPQLALIIAILSLHGATSNILYGALTMTLISLVYGIGRHCYFAYLWYKHARKHHSFYPPTEGVFSYGSANYLLENTVFMENTLILAEPTLIFGNQNNIVFNEPTQIWGMTNNPADRPDYPFVYVIYPDQKTTVEACVFNSPLKFGGVDEGVNTIGFDNPLILPNHCEIRWSQLAPQSYTLYSYGQTLETATLINGRIAPTNTPIVLYPNDIVQFGTPTGPRSDVVPVAFCVRFISPMMPNYMCACMAIQLAPGSTPYTGNLLNANDIANSDNFVSVTQHAASSSRIGYVASSTVMPDGNIIFGQAPPAQVEPTLMSPPTFFVGGPNVTLAPAIVVLRAQNFGGCSVVDISNNALLIGSGGDAYDKSPNFLRLHVPGVSPVQVQIFATTISEKLSFRATDPGSLHGTMVNGQFLARPQTDTLYFEEDKSVTLNSGSIIQLTETFFIQVSQIMPVGQEPFIELLFPDAAVIDVNGCYVIRNYHSSN